MTTTEMKKNFVKATSGKSVGGLLAQSPLDGRARWTTRSTGIPPDAPPVPGRSTSVSAEMPGETAGRIAKEANSGRAVKGLLSQSTLDGRPSWNTRSAGIPSVPPVRLPGKKTNSSAEARVDTGRRKTDPSEAPPVARRKAGPEKT